MKENTENEFTKLENKTIGRNLSKFRKFKEKKAFEVAEFIGIGEAAYSKYERGETKITIDIIQKVAEFLSLDPLQLITSNEGHSIENGNNSPGVVGGNVEGNNNFQTVSKEQNEMMLKLMENVIEMNSKIMDLLEKKS